jgi:cobalt/nickel transport system permease protein
MAHIPDGFLSAPVLAGAAVLSAGALALAARRSRHQLGDRQAPLLGAATAFVFAAQMLDFPLGAGSSAHLLGGVLVAVLVGPWSAMLVLFSVVLVQALLFQDGGIAALGANALNLAVIGAGGGWLVYRWATLLLGDGRRRRLAAAGVAGFVSALATGVAAGLQLGLSGMVPVRTGVLVVGGAHVLVGAAEAVLTVGILAMVLRARPELALTEPPASTPRRVAAVAGTAGAVALAAATFGSGLPDALESAVARLGLPGGAPLIGAPMPDYASPLGGAWVAGLTGVAVVFALGWLVFRAAAAAVAAGARAPDVPAPRRPA